MTNEPLSIASVHRSPAGHIARPELRVANLVVHPRELKGTDQEAVEKIGRTVIAVLVAPWLSLMAPIAEDYAPRAPAG